MTREPMRLPARGVRIPGFAQPAGAAVVEDLSAPGTRQVNLRLRVSLHRSACRMVRDLEEEGFETSMTELVQALIYSGPRETSEAKELIRAWRRAVVG